MFAFPLLNSSPDQKLYNTCLQAHPQGRRVLLTFSTGDAIKIACDHGSNPMLLARAAQLVWNKMLDKKSILMDLFKLECQQDSAPKS